MAGKRTKGPDLGLDKPVQEGLTGSPPGEIDGSMNQGIADSVAGANVDPDGGTQMGSHPAKRQTNIMRFYG